MPLYELVRIADQAHVDFFRCWHDAVVQADMTNRRMGQCVVEVRVVWRND